MKCGLVELFRNNSDYEFYFTKNHDKLIIDKKNKTISFPEIILTSSFDKRRIFFASMVVDLIPLFEERTNNDQLFSKVITSLSAILLD